MPGQGSTFWFTARLTKNAGSATPTAEPVDSVDAEARLRQAHRGERVLLVEDNDINQEVACELLRYVGLVVDVAGDGLEAIDAVARRPTDPTT